MVRNLFPHLLWNYESLEIFKKVEAANLPSGLVVNPLSISPESPLPAAAQDCFIAELLSRGLNLSVPPTFSHEKLG